MYFTESRPSRSSLPDGAVLPRPALVLIHGAGGSQLSWPVEIRRLAGFRVLALDLPGHGKSEGVALQKAEDYSRAVETFLRELGIFSVVLVGHSLGAAIAIHFTCNNPDQVCGLVLLSAAARFPIPADILQAVADQETYPIGLAIIKQRFFSPRTTVHTRSRVMLPLEKQRSTVLYSDFMAASRVDFRSGLPLKNCPCWAACGRQDLITPVSMGRALTAGMSSVAFSEIPASGHMLPLEQPTVVAQGLQRFLSRHKNFVFRKNRAQ